MNWQLWRACRPGIFVVLLQRSPAGPPIAYLNYYRIECACERLTLTDKSVTEIAFACGFNDMSYFSRVFKQLKGTTPTAYRN